YARAFYEGEKADGVELPINLIRCAWAGSAKYGALVWSGDVPSTFAQMKNQYTAGLHMAMAGIPWWTADIGGFHGGNIHDPAFWELLVRWFQMGTYFPVMRLHGDRDPHDQPPLGVDGGGMCSTGADNEVWSYPKEIGDILVKHIHIRNRMKEYIRSIMAEAHYEGKPVMRPLYYEFPKDPECWNEHEEYLFGGELLVCPVFAPGIRMRDVYFPEGEDWEAEDGTIYPGGTHATVAAPLDIIPVFRRKRKTIDPMFY
ncbi:MAG: TIM-barrel domain-containing protein, partial [Christensenellaceae bacterium]